MRLNVGFGTDVGQKRQKNQDSGAVFPELGLCVVADGMGGHLGGEIASSMVVEIVPEILRQKIQDAKKSHTELNVPVALSEAITQASQSIFEHAQKETSLQGMGTTTTTLFFHNDILSIGHVGDSRCYYFRPDSFWQITRDHSLVQEKLRAGLITREQVRTDRMKNVITRSVGFEPNVMVDVYEMAVYPGDVFLVCSDGLTGLVEEKDILKIVQRDFFQSNNIQLTVDHLIKAANINGGDDNITVILVQVLGTSG